MSEKADIFKELASRRLTLFQPRTSGDLRKEYPELDRYEEFSRAKLTQHEVRFIWWFSCQGSPFYDLPESDKLDACIDLAFPESLRDARRVEYKDLRFPSKIKSAMDRMAAFSLPARAMNFVMASKMYDKLSQNLSAPLVDAADYAKMSKDTLAAMESCTRMLEGLGSGISEEEDKLNEARNTAGALRRHHQNRQL